MKLLFAAVCFLVSCNIQDANAQARLIGVIPPRYDPNSVVVIFNKYGRNVCSGSLIHSQWVLTSATCALRVASSDEMRVKVGGAVSLDFNTAEHIKNTYIHPGFRAWTLDNDIALIKLVSPTRTSVRTLKIASDGGVLTGQKAYVLGYGDNGTITADGTLRQHKISILDNMICWPYPVFINCDKLCTYESRACEGDQGGPLVSEDKGTLLGLVSISETQASMCGGDKIIPVTTYTRVSSYRQWIIETTKINYL